ncbi:hypothetical protein B0J12DRAFT_740164 [Macrophomina phaseolina]|uniref:Uncharacterized protein n=1 Tax=Macrophomina phaseolina TaxID=35725 RepID=A0ABQ8GBX4_9PEZI|nr:hypothetical protein B0J12DRAFT_740164 [Macrophomina phaseolina]
MQLNSLVALTIGCATSLICASPTQDHSYCDWRTGRQGAGKQQCIQQCASIADLVDKTNCLDSWCQRRVSDIALRGSCRCNCHQPRW